MSPLNNIRKSAICLNPVWSRAYEIVKLAEKLPVWARRHAVPATAYAAVAAADLRAREVMAFKASQAAR